MWTNVGQIHWRIYAALGGDDLNVSSFLDIDTVQITEIRPYGTFIQWRHNGYMYVMALDIISSTTHRLFN